MVPRPEMERDLKAQEKEIVDDINSLNKKVGIRLRLWLLAKQATSQSTWRSNSMKPRDNFEIS